MPGTVPDLTPAAQAYIRALETRLEQAERALRLLPQQRGPLPGWLRAGVLEASTIYAAKLAPPLGTTGPQGSLDLSGATPGQSPLLDINDGTRDRVQIGNLAAYTDPNGIASPAMYGGRAVDPNGFLIWDTIGNSQVMSILGTPVKNASQMGVTGNGSWQTVSGTTVSFTLNRNVSVLALGAMTVVDPTVGDTGFNLEASVLVDGAQSNNLGPVFAPGTASFPCTPWAFFTNTGAHTVALGVNQTNTHMWTAIGCYLFAFLLGS